MPSRKGSCVAGPAEVELPPRVQVLRRARDFISPKPRPPVPNPAGQAAGDDRPGASCKPANCWPADPTGPGPVIEAMPPDEPGGLSPWGLSSIARNRLANRCRPGQPVAGRAWCVGLLGAAGGSGPGGREDEWCGVSSILRNRLDRAGGAGEEPGYTYPDIHAEPARIYRDRYGVFEDEEPDRFLFPWIVNLIFEDRWLLAERDPAVALQNQLRRRLNVDIRDPDPDTANFPNGAYTLQKGRPQNENSPVGFTGRLPFRCPGNTCCVTD